MSVATSRTAQYARNAGASILAQVVVIILGFVTRTVFVAQLGVAMLGINAMLTSALAMLTLADMGINSALMYALYKPLRDGDTRTTAAIVRYAGRLFRWVAVAVAVFGLALTPFVHHLVRLEEGVEHLEVYYLILLTNTVVGYLMLNRLVLLNADQKIYLTKIYSIAFNVLRSVAQIVSLLIYQDFIVFLAIQVFFTFANNVVVYIRAGQIYPHIKGPAVLPSGGERRSIWQSTRAMLIYRVGGLILTHSTPLLVSVLVGTVALGYYSNYMLIVSAAIMTVEVAFSALTPSVGNLIAAGDRAAGRRVFDEMVLLTILVHGVIAIGFVAFVDHFVFLWLGQEFVLPAQVVGAIVLNFYVAGTLMPLWSFRSATGLFRQTRLIMLFTAVVSIVLSFAFGHVLGMAGVVAAPAIARLLTGAWYEPWILIRDHLTGKSLSYFSIQAISFVLWCAVAAFTLWVGTLFTDNLWTSIIVKATLIAIIFPTISWLMFRRTKAFQSLIRRLPTLVREKREGSA